MNVITLILIPCIKTNMFFIFDRSQGEFIGTDPHWHTFINNKYLCYGHLFNASTSIYTWYCVEQKGQKVVIANQEEYDDMTQLEKNKIAIIQNILQNSFVFTNVNFFTCKKILRQNQKSILDGAKLVRNFKIPEKYLKKLKARYKNFNLIEFDEWERKYYGHQAFHNGNIKYYYRYMWPTFDYASFRSDDKEYDWWLRSNNDIYNKKSKLPIKTAVFLKIQKKLFDKSVIPIKILVEKLGDLPEITLQQNTSFYMMKVITSIILSTLS